MTDLNLNELREVAEAATDDGATLRHVRAHMVTFDPPTVLALLDRVAELEAKVARVEVLANSWARLDSGQPEWCRRAGLKVRAALAKEARVESLRQAAEVVVLDAGDEATGPEPDPNLAELAHCVAALDVEAVGGVPGRSEAEIKAAGDAIGHPAVQAFMAAMVPAIKAEALRQAAKDPALRLAGHGGISVTRLLDRAARLAKEDDQ